MGVVLGLYAVRNIGPFTPTNEILGWLRAATLLGVLAVALGPDLPAHRVRDSRRNPSAAYSDILLSESPDSVIT